MNKERRVKAEIGDLGLKLTTEEVETGVTMFPSVNNGIKLKENKLTLVKDLDTAMDYTFWADFFALAYIGLNDIKMSWEGHYANVSFVPVIVAAGLGILSAMARIPLEKGIKNLEQDLREIHRERRRFHQTK